MKVLLLSVFLFLSTSQVNFISFLCPYQIVQKSNPLPKESSYLPRKSSGEPKSVFQEQLRAEHELFKAIFSKRQQRIGLDLDDE